MSKENKIFAISLPKISEEEKDIQDDYSIIECQQKIAIADGASTSFLPKEWAKILVQYFCYESNESLSEISNNYQEWLKICQEKWRQEYYLPAIKNPQWYGRPSGNKYFAAATFVGLKLHHTHEKGENIWEVIAVGDSCIFKISRDYEFESFPLTNSHEFNSTPECLKSFPDEKSYPFKYDWGYYQEGDQFLFATDALAKWILKNKESDSKQWKELLKIEKKEEFIDFIKQLRNDKQIENDDTTLIRYEVINIPEKKFSREVKQQPRIEPDKPNLSANKEIINTINNENEINTNEEENMIVKQLKKIDSKIDSKLDKLTNFLIALNLANLGVSTVLFLVIILFLIPRNNVINRNIQELKTSLEKSQNTSLNNSEKQITFPLYDASKQIPRGYLAKKTEERELTVWVQFPVNYEENNELNIPNNNVALPLYQATDNPADINLKTDFLGYIIGGKYSLSHVKESQTFPNTKWGKITVYTSNK